MRKELDNIISKSRGSPGMNAHLVFLVYLGENQILADKQTNFLWCDKIHLIPISIETRTLLGVGRHTDVVDGNALIVRGESEDARGTLLVRNLVRHLSVPGVGFILAPLPRLAPDDPEPSAATSTRALM